MKIVNDYRNKTFIITLDVYCELYRHPPHASTDVRQEPDRKQWRKDCDPGGHDCIQWTRCLPIAPRG